MVLGEFCRTVNSGNFVLARFHPLLSYVSFSFFFSKGQKGMYYEQSSGAFSVLCCLDVLEEWNGNGVTDRKATCNIEWCAGKHAA